MDLSLIQKNSFSKSQRLLTHRSSLYRYERWDAQTQMGWCTLHWDYN